MRVAEALHGICTVVDYNCEEDPDTCRYVGVVGFPEFGLFENNKLIAYNGDDDYSFESLVDFIKDKEYLRDEYRQRVKVQKKKMLAKPAAKN